MMCLKTPSEISTILASVEVLQSLVSGKTVTPNCNQHGPLGLRELEAIILFLTSVCSWLVFYATSSHFPETLIEGYCIQEENSKQGTGLLQLNWGDVRFCLINFHQGTTLMAD